MPTNQGDRQAFFRAISGTTTDYNGDFLAAAAVDSFTGEFNGVFVEWLQDRTGSSATNLDGLKQEFAVLAGAHNWESTGGVPIILPSCQLWLDAADDGTITHDSGDPDKVSQWNDKSGNGRNATQGTGSKQFTTGATTFNSKNVIDNDGGDVMDVSGLTAILSEAVDFTLFAVFQTDVNDTTDRTIFASAAGSNDRMTMGRTNSDTFIVGVFDGSFEDLEVSYADTTNLHIGVFVNTPDVTGRFDGTAMVGGADSPSVSGTVGTTIGARTNEAAFWNGSIAEIILYSRELSTVETVTIETYLSNKWGVTLA